MLRTLSFSLLASSLFMSEALASPFACCSRVTSRDSPKWRACSQVSFRFHFHKEWMKRKESNLITRVCNRIYHSIVIWSRAFWPSITWNLVRKTRALEQERFDLRSEAWNSTTLPSRSLLLVLQCWQMSLSMIYNLGQNCWENCALGEHFSRHRSCTY